jgi:FlgD Ig-like domain
MFLSRFSPATLSVVLLACVPTVQASTLSTFGTHGRLSLFLPDTTVTAVYSTTWTLSRNSGGGSGFVSASVTRLGNRVTADCMAHAAAGSGETDTRAETSDSYFQYLVNSSGGGCGIVLNADLSRTARCGYINIRTVCMNGGTTRWTSQQALAASDSMRLLANYLCGPTYNGDLITLYLTVDAASPAGRPDSCFYSEAQAHLTLDLVEGNVVDPLVPDFTWTTDPGTCGSVFHPSNLTLDVGNHNGYIWGHSYLWNFGDCSNYNGDHSSADANGYYDYFTCDPSGCGPVSWNMWIAPPPSGCSTGHPVTLTVSSPFNAASVQHAITNYSSPPAVFTYSYPDPSDSTQVLFTAPPNPPCPPTAWHWSFGDQTTSNERNPLHAFTLGALEQRRTFLVSLTVDETSTCTSSYSHSVLVVKPEATDVGDRGAATFSMRQNRPNPARSGAWIQYSVRGSGPVKLDVFDAGGRHVATLEAGLPGPGSHTVWWGGTDDVGRSVVSGIYWYRVQEGSNSIIRKMVLVK